MEEYFAGSDPVVSGKEAAGFEVSFRLSDEETAGSGTSFRLSDKRAAGFEDAFSLSDSAGSFFAAVIIMAAVKRMIAVVLFVFW
ncbi:MAG: hypothetical protein HFH29_15195 [Eubacterium sp.]|nr:hypothetical protein [Eubacterium sp.]